MVKAEYISIADFAKLIGKSRITVFKKVKKGEIKAIKIGRSYAIPKKEVERIVGDIIGHPLNEKQKKGIDRVIDRTVEEFGEALKELGID